MAVWNLDKFFSTKKNGCIIVGFGILFIIFTIVAVTINNWNIISVILISCGIFMVIHGIVTILYRIKHN